LFRPKRKPSPATHAGFTLPEVMVASCIGAGIGGAMIFLLLQGAVEQRLGLAGATVEQQAYTLQSSILACLRGMSANQGLAPDVTSAVKDSSGNLLGYRNVFLFNARADGSYTRGQISVSAAMDRVAYIPDVTVPTNTIVWFKNSTNVALRQLCFNTSFNPDGSMNSSLVNVQFLMDDNGASQQSANRNNTSIYRTFSVRLRGDN
jgi:hypothetical protein